jgi:hypothetical protein
LSRTPFKTTKKGEIMKLYQAVKIVKAEPMTLKEYADFKKGFKDQPEIYHNIAEVPKNHSLDTPGYLVCYPGKDGKTFDGKLPHECRYISWAPGDVFEGVHNEYQESEESSQY